LTSYISPSLDRVNELDSAVESLESQLQDQEVEANKAISEWQDRSSELEAKILSLERDLSSSQEALADREKNIQNLQGLDDQLAYDQESWRSKSGKLQNELADEKGRHQKAMDEIEALTRSLVELKSDSERDINKWTGTNSLLQAMNNAYL
jgi:chromosome segregation ATPase